MESTTPYFGYKIYGPYTRKDGRQHIIAYKSKLDKMTVSYPKYIVEVVIGRYLNPDENVHHIDGNFINNSLDNLQIVDKAEHVRAHNQKYEELDVKCVNC
jgi:hypothetical protein